MPRYQYKHRRPPRRQIRFWHIFLALVLVGMIAYPFMEAAQTNVREYTTDIADLPSNLRNLEIVFLTDIHQNTKRGLPRTEAIIKTVNSLGPDLVLFGGDYAADVEGAIAFFETLPLIQARLGAYGVLGTHDRGETAEEITRLMQAMVDAGVTPLVNEVATIRVGKANLYVAGIDDMDWGDPDVAAVAGQVSTDDVVILLAHNPDLLSEAVRAVDKDGKTHWFDLALFGHTHGGQIKLLGKPLLSGFSPQNPRYLSGWITENRAEILISNGLGTATVPMRLFAPPEIHLIRLR